MDVHKEIDTRGLTCPLPILKAKKALADMQSGQTLRVVATDPSSTRDFQAYEVELEGLSGSMVIDSPRIGATSKEQKAFVAKANDSDLIVWALAADKPDAGTA